MGLMVSIYESKANGNCSNNGISANAEHVVIVNAEGPFKPNSRMPGVYVIEHPAGPRYGPIAVPAEEPEGHAGPMAGGAFISCSDSRFHALLESLGSTASAIPLHDRFESWDLYNRMSG